MLIREETLRKPRAKWLLLGMLTGIVLVAGGVGTVPFVAPVSFYWGDSHYTLTGIRPGGYRDGVVEPGLRTYIYYSFTPSEETTLGLGRIGYELESHWWPRELRERYGVQR
jgi:hypothetical protein